MEKEIWNIVRATDFKNVSDPSKIRILDIGCGPGNAFYHFFVDFETTYFTGIEKKSKDNIKEDLCAFKTYACKKLSKCLEKHSEENQDTIDPYFYFQKLIEYKILNPKTEINENKFNSLFIDKILWETKIEESNILENTTNKFDLILLSKVLHFKDIDNPHYVIKKCINLLTEDGLIFIKSEKIKESSTHRKEDEETFKSWIKDLNEFKEIENDCEFLYFLGTKYYTVHNKGY